MVRIVVFCVVTPFAAMELLIYRRYDFALLGALYLALSIQADFAAGRFLREGLGKPGKRRHWSEEEQAGGPEEIKVPPLGEGARKPDTTYYPPPPPRAEAAPTPQPRPERRRGRRGILAPLPNFHGRAHEVLGVEENAATRTIVHAFRHWIKRFHPDQARDLPAALANAKVRQLTDAKELLLERRRARRAA